MELCNILRPHLQTVYVVRVPLTVEHRVAICLWRLATNVEFRTISHLFGVGLSTACNIVMRVTKVIAQVMRPQFIATPCEEEFKVIIQGYRDLYGFPQCGGAIDGTHIGTLAPSEFSSDYYNRKGFYSTILQAVVDHRLRFWSIYVGWPGRVHDARVFSNSSLCKKGQTGTLFPNITEHIMGVDVPVVMPGDGAYPLLSWLIKPYAEAGATQQQKHFNYRLSRARMTVERAFGRLKGRWRSLMKRYDGHVSNINTTVTACCVLHNFCEVHKEEYDDDSGGDGNTTDWNSVQENTVAGATTRDALCSFFALP